MKYALHEGQRSQPPQGLGGSPRRPVQAGPVGPVDAPLGRVDPQLLASALDRLTREVLYLNLPLHEAWEQLREQLRSGAAPRRQ